MTPSCELSLSAYGVYRGMDIERVQLAREKKQGSKQTYWQRVVLEFISMTTIYELNALGCKH